MNSFISNTEPKVFGVGLSRTGTTSLNQALRMLQFQTYHWGVPSEKRLARLEDCYLSDGVTDINAAFMFETLFYIFPNAKFIYTTRPIDSWKRAISGHYNLETPRGLLQRLRETPVATSYGALVPVKNTILFQAMHHALYTAHMTWEDAYKAHDDRVRQFFQDKPGKLLEFDIFDRGHGWPELCAFLGREPPEAPYPELSWKAPSPRIAVDQDYGAIDEG